MLFLFSSSEYPTQNMGYVSDFSPNGRLFALLDSDGKLKIWDIKPNRLTQEYVPDLHLNRPYTCFVWFTVGHAQSRNSKHDADTTLYIALGTSQGGVDLYSHATGKIESRLKGNGHSGAVTSICLHTDSTLYTSGEDCEIVEWSLNQGCDVRHFSIGRITPTCIISLPISNTLLVGCKELHQWSLGKRPESMSTLTGHSADITSMKVIQLADRNEEYVVTTAKSNREIYLFKIGAKKNQKAIFLMEYAASFVSCSLVGSKLVIAAVTGVAGGVVHLFAVDNISDINKKRMNPKVTLTVAYDSESVIAPIPIIAATTNFSQSDCSNILIGFGNSPKLCFEDVRYNPHEKKQTLLREDPRIQINRQAKTKEHFNTLVPNTTDPNIHFNTGGAIKSKTGRKTTADYQAEITLIERLNTTSMGESDDARGHSQVELLKQALQNHDATLIRTVLSNKDENVIRSTLKRLPTHYVSGLIDQLAALTQKKTANVQIAVRWLKLLLQIHASQLMALGKNELHDRFGVLLGIIDNRTHCLVQLTELSGRLDFLLNQIKRNTDDDPTFNHENLLVFEDEASDAENSDVNGIDDGNSTDEDDVDMVNGDESTEDEASDDSMDGSLA